MLSLAVCVSFCISSYKFACSFMDIYHDAFCDGACKFLSVLACVFASDAFVRAGFSNSFFSSMRTSV